MVLEELLALSKNHGMMGSRALDWPLDCGFDPKIQPQVLRLSKSIHSLGSAILHRANKWIIFDMDCAHLLISWARADLGMIIVDPESTQALPSGMMRVRIKLYTQESGYERAIRLDWPAALTERQIILVSADDLPKFLESLRIVEFANGVRVMPGQSFNSFDTTVEKSAVRGVHGLSMCIHVDSFYRQSELTACLEQFRMFHGPLNELSIIGAPDDQQVQEIEASISVSRDPKLETKFSELLMHVVRLMTLANIRIDQEHTVAEGSLFEQARAMVLNSHIYDRTPYTGWVKSTNAHESLLELLIISLPGLHWMLHDIVNDGSLDFADALHAISSHPYPLAALLFEQDGLEAELGAQIILLSGLHCVFSSYVKGRSCIELFRHGMDLIEETQVLVAQMPHSKVCSGCRKRENACETYTDTVPPLLQTILFRTAYKMCEMLRSLDEGSDAPAFMDVASTFHRWFNAHMKFIKWQVHESHISKTQRNEGILAMMTKVTLPHDANLDKYQIIDTLRWSKKRKATTISFESAEIRLEEPRTERKMCAWQH
jgi:hypothetical protein